MEKHQQSSSETVKPLAGDFSVAPLTTHTLITNQLKYLAWAVQKILYEGWG